MYQVFTPKSEILKKHIYNYCVLKPFDGPVNYLAFPQLGTSMALYSHSKLKIEDNCISVSKAIEPNHQILILGKYKLPLQLEYSEYSPEISINFTPTGLNYFFKENIGVMANAITQFLNDEKWVTLANQIFEEKSSCQKRDTGCDCTGLLRSRLHPRAWRWAGRRGPRVSHLRSVQPIRAGRSAHRRVHHQTGRVQPWHFPAGVYRDSSSGL